MRQLRTLIIDDNPRDVEALLPSIEALGDRWEAAASLDEAKEMFSPDKYDYILLDLELPSKPGGLPLKDNGELFLLAVRSSWKLAPDAFPVFITSGYFDGDTMHRMYDTYGISDYLMKDYKSHSQIPAQSILEHTRHLRQEVQETPPVETTPAAMPVQETVSSNAWLRVEHGVKTNVWTSIAVDGRTRTFPVENGSKRDRLLSCICDNCRRDCKIPHNLIQDGCNWDGAVYNHQTRRDNRVRPARGPLKAMKALLREKLGIDLIIGPLCVEVKRPQE